MKNLRFRTRIVLSLSALVIIVLTAVFYSLSAIIQPPILRFVSLQIERVYQNLENLQNHIIETQTFQAALLTYRQDIGAAIESLDEIPRYVEERKRQLEEEPRNESVDVESELLQLETEFRGYAINTIREQIDEVQGAYSSLISPDFIVVADTAAEIIYASPELATDSGIYAQLPLMELTESDRPPQTKFVHNGSLYQMAINPLILGSQVKGYLALGFRFDSKLIFDILPERDRGEETVGLGPIHIAFVSPDGELLAENFDTGTENKDLRADFIDYFSNHIPAFASQQSMPFSFESGMEEITGRAWPILNHMQQPVAYQAVMTSKTEALSVLRQILFAFMIIAVVSILVSLALSWFISRSVTRPVDLLAHAAEQLRQGDLDHAIRYGSKDELGVLADAMERMRIGILERIEQIKSLQNELVQKEKLASIGSVASAINHEIRNQLSFGMAAELIRQQHPKDEVVQEYTQMILDARDYILRMLDDIRNFTRAGSSIEYAKADARLDEMLDHTIRFAGFDKELKHIRIQQDVQSLPPLHCDIQRISQVVINMIRNAGHATEGDGEVFVRLCQESDQAVIEIEDQGVGIPPENLEKIWEPFFSTKGDKGLGLGLDICRKIIGDHGGSVDCKSQVGQGTTFTIRLPYSNS